MWLHIPSEQSACAQESGGLISDLREQNPELELYATSSGKPMRRPLSWRGWTNRPWIRRLSGTISIPSQRNSSEAVSSWLSEASPANPTVPPGKDLEQPTQETSGLLPCESSKDSTSQPYFWRTYPPSGPEDYQEFSGTWPSWGMMWSGVCFQMPNWEPHTDAPDCSSWPTPTAQSYGSNKGGAAGRTGKTRPSLDTLGKNWTTPQARDGKGAQTGTYQCLNRDTQNWPTPKARDWKPAGGVRKAPDLNTEAVAFGHPDKTAQSGLSGLNNTGRRLNVLFVERLMGFPRGWSSPTNIAPTDYELWGMQLAPLWPLWLGECLQGGCND